MILAGILAGVIVGMEIVVWGFSSLLRLFTAVAR